MWNRSKSSSVDELAAAGATVAASPSQALSTSVSFSMLADDSVADGVAYVAVPIDPRTA